MKRLLLCLLLIAGFCHAETPILTPAFSQRQTAKITLENGLRAYIISDPNLEQSGAVLTVQAGSWNDPTDSPGIAHFLEHMLFLGTKKYPNEGEYQKFISHHNGMANAFTASTYTAYFFTIDNSAFPEAIDRFSHFFKEPLFNPSGVSRELKAIDQEYAKNLESDDWRQYFVLKELASPEHPENRFNIGNRETLKDVSQETLKKWYREHYSANLMQLVVYSPLPLEELKATVQRDFSEIANKQLASSYFDNNVIPDDLKGKLVYVQPIKNMRTLTFVWELPRPFSNMSDTQPDHILAYLLGHEGKESLLAQLKREKLAEGLKAGSGNRGDATLLFEIEITLTDYGVDHMNDVITRTFQALADLRKKGVPQPLFEEMKRMATIEYQYQQREPLFTTLAKDAHYLPLVDFEKYPEQAYITERFDPVVISELLEILRPDNAVYFLRAPSALTGVKPNNQEQWMGVGYAVRPIPKREIEAWTQIEQGHPNITLPKENPFIPSNLSVINKPVANEQLPLVPKPDALIASDEGILYFAPDDRYGVPKVFWRFDIKSPVLDASKPSKVVLADLFVKAVKEAMNKFSYSAEMAGLKYEIVRSDFAITVQIEGYSEHAPKLFGEILRRMRELHPTDEKFKIYKHSILREYQNAAKELPVKQALETLKKGIYKSYSLPKQNLSAARRINLDKFNQFSGELFDEYYVEALMYGNQTREDALKTWQLLRETLGGRPYPKDVQKQQEVILLPGEKGPFYLDSTTKAQGNAVALAIQGNDYSFENKASQQILGKALEQAFFGELRTKQQTGYIVQSWLEEIERQMFQLFVVQSSSHNVQDLLARFELFFEGYVQELPHDVTPEAFNQIRQSLLTQLSTPQKSYADMGRLLQLLAFKYDGRFDWLEKRIEGFNTLTYEKFLENSRDFLGRNNRKRLAILISGETPDAGPEYQKLGNLEQLRKIGRFVTKHNTSDSLVTEITR